MIQCGAKQGRVAASNSASEWQLGFHGWRADEDRWKGRGGGLVTSAGAVALSYRGAKAVRRRRRWREVGETHTVDAGRWDQVVSGSRR